MMGLIDTHTHLYVEEFDVDRDAVMARAYAAGISHLFLPNIDDTTLERLWATCRKYERCYPLLGLHPTSVDTDWERRLSVIRSALESGTIIYGIGEVGMDLYWDKTFVEEQMLVFDRQIQWALERRLPIVMHCRDAFSELFEVLAPYRGMGLRGILHSFTGTADDAAQALSHDGLLLGINGVVTFKNSTLPEVLQQVTLERIVVETDAPYLAPVPFRGKRNESAYLPNIVKKLAEVYACEEDLVIQKTTENAYQLFLAEKE